MVKACAILLAVTAARSGRFNYSVHEWVFPAALLVLGIGILTATLRGLKSERLAEATATETDPVDDAGSLD